MLLIPNMKWAANQGIALPSVLVETEKTADYFAVHFTIEEPMDCFRAEVKEDNGSSWEDSCVEIFLRDPANPTEYYNFETTSRGYLLAAHGPDRNSRVKLSQEQINSVVRIKQLASVAGNLVCWGMTVQISPSLFGLRTFDGVTLCGNIYKCADKAKTPHYLSAFPVETEKPDFHRPEFFREF
ncbi:carbohydrate-binding family 9-like protein [uncultured Fibrobacter sp.]|uniref:carbohydrate-binding family 9-like protein n=1 Tax=uncultured Fibrobacter sp. TaxID=261512 RepID=UPI0026326E10|nr:carbohydrate-binding family 9-like protein [uncultured Fibrobacter sp.]